MCVWYYAESKSLSYFISKAQQLPLAHEMMITMSRSMAMSGNIRPTDMAAVLAPNKQGRMAVFPMIWGFTHEATDKPIVNCRVESADQKALWKDSWYGASHMKQLLSRSSTAALKPPIRRLCGRILGSDGGVLSLLHGIMSGVFRPPKSVSGMRMSSAASRKRSM